MEELKVALLGAGTVGSQVVRLLEENAEDFAVRAGAKLKIIGIAVRDTSKPRDPAIARSLLTDDAESIIDQADIVIELMGGIEPARTYILRAMAGGASVVTGNKALLAEYGPEIYDAAAAADVDLYYEAAVGGAVPIVYGLRESLAGDNVLSVLGVLNGTTNYILDEMTHNGLSYAEALRNAQELGYAEADPTADVDGFDAAAKCAILASLAFHTRINLEDVHTHGIRDITPEQIAAAKREGYVVKLVASAKRRPHGIELYVGPSLVPQGHPLSTVHGAYNAVVIDSEASDRLMFYGPGAGGSPTASAVLSDVVAAANKKVYGGHAPRELIYGELPVLSAAESRSRFQLRMAVPDVVGVLAAITSVFAHHGVSISAVAQESVLPENKGHNRAILTVTTHEASQRALEDTIAQLREGIPVAASEGQEDPGTLPVEISSFIRVEEA
ncbi:homoserine dehydrogenase [Actinobaculum suis]|uniref:Homoserine dehydrogenase n=1 Tax=Actinobaculum suis TaxID=1657 RepID=A0A0K9ET14_9ACTO|nr:homoserine dehydrogenase [Actinobaculum suis]KMY23005.1 homoserine dehydrogenase [Actinobaculum suis]MDY5152981.1 homoserine dehydrogenase [Actinobaculum suis]OCA94625.1 homoserine dehydrogenase [Actinobaculum suis]OCA94937.1 homoserine dehydrogenase [Actinobaculum suis]SDE37610.1 homoserine dehydrogenase [Actinobaculum suis]